MLTPQGGRFQQLLWSPKTGKVALWVLAALVGMIMLIGWLVGRNNTAPPTTAPPPLPSHWQVGNTDNGVVMQQLSTGGRIVRRHWDETLKLTDDLSRPGAVTSFFCREGVGRQFQIAIDQAWIDFGDNAWADVYVYYYEDDTSGRTEITVEMRLTANSLNGLYLPPMDRRGRPQYLRLVELFRDAERHNQPVFTLVPEDMGESRYYGHGWRTDGFWRQLNEMTGRCAA